MITHARVVGEQSYGRWSLAELIAFRFAFAVTALSSLFFSTFVTPYLFFDALKRPVQIAIGPVWNAELRTAMSIGSFIISRASGDHSTLQAVVARYMQGMAVSWNPRNGGLTAAAYMLGLAVVASLVAMVWSYADRRRANYERLYRWMRVWARYVLALVAMVYAMTKVVPTQFGFLAPGEMLRPVGQLSEFALLWHFMAASTLYTVFAGLAELAGVLLLFFRRTTLAGALVLGAALTNIVVMDFAYHVGGGGTIAALLLLMLDLIVLAPYAPSIVSFLFLGRAAAATQEPGLLSRGWRYSPVVSCVVFALLVSVLVQDSLTRRRTYFGAGHPVYGLFNVERFERNGTMVTPLATDGTVWKRVGNVGRSGGGGLSVFGLTVQLADGDIRQYPLTDDTVNHVWTLRQESTDVAALRYTIESDATVSLEGRVGKDSVKMSLRRVDPQEFSLLTR